MVDIICTDDQKEEILNWMVVTDTEMFSDVVRCGFSPEQNGHPGIFSFRKAPSKIIADSGEDEFFYEGHAMRWELEQFYRKLKKQFPSIGLDGYVIVTDKYSEAFRIEADPANTDIDITELDLNLWD